ncbi:hypothetical protein MJO28_001395 [Puccinia striiformis f. sp. tritici]|uniref:Uncharacterized protein n=1 Tax=Puccinia striiformis f. sp. tritici TaxID=168172 RepID=A0ACC0EUY5_9BASI|nr:hypothetical protein MJO28_001395 [Puccinia striiformis f. sp. tritici]
MIASQLLLVSVWIVSIPSGLTASVGGPNFAIEANQAEADTSRGLRALAVEEKSGRKLSSIIPFMTYRRKTVRSKKGLETIENWNLNQDQVVSLQKYTAQLTEYEAEIQQQFKWLGRIARNIDQITQDLPQAEALFNKIKQGVTELKHWKLMLLGEVYNRFPDEIFGLITESLSRNLVQSVKKFITEQNHLFSCLAIYFEPKHPKFQHKKDKRYRFYTLTPLDYAFKIIDFLFENGFISAEEVRDIFQDENMVYQVVNYTVRRYENDLGFFSWRFMINLTKHWHWKSINTFSTALSKKELDRIDLVFLIGKLKCIGDVYLVLYDARRASRWHDRLFPYEKYFSKSNALNASNSLGLLRYQHRQIGHQIYPELNVGEMNEIIQQLLPRSYYDANLNCIVDLFAFMEEELCPGIVSQLLKNEHLSNQFKNLVKLSGNGHKPEDVFHLALIYSRNEMICHSAKQLIKSIFLDQETRTQFYILRDKEIYQDHIDKKREILTRRQDTYLKLSSVGTFHDQDYRRHQMLYPHFVEEDLTKTIAILDHTIEYEEMRRNLIEKKQKPYARRARILDDIFS